MIAIDSPSTASKLLQKSNGAFPTDIFQKMDVAILGEHHGDVPDHNMEVEFISAFAEAKGRGNSALGLEMVSQTFQPVLDAFNSGEITMEVLFKDTQWSRRWGWPASGYAPVFEAARERGMRLVALDIPFELRNRVQLQGLNGMTADERARYLPDQFSYIASQSEQGYAGYRDKILIPGYEIFVSSGMLASTDAEKATPKNFVECQNLRDEAIASAVWRQLQGIQKPGFPSKEPLQSMVALVGFNHARFDFGVPRRLRRLGSGAQRCRLLADQIPILDQPGGSQVGVLTRGAVFQVAGLNTSSSSFMQLVPGGCGYVSLAASPSGEPSFEKLSSRPFSVKTILLNPKPIDTNNYSGSDSYNLALKIDGAPVAQYPKLSDYCWLDSDTFRVERPGVAVDT